MNPKMRYAESFLTDLFAAYGMDIDYVRAHRNTLFYRDENGAEVPVLDLVGGWGSLMLGHNHPEIVACAKEFLDSDFPVHSQLSLHRAADQVGELLNDILHREFPGAEDYAITFANSGAEAIEVAVKHAELDRLLKVKKFFEDMEWNIGAAIGAVATGAAALPDVLPDGQEPPTDIPGLVAALTALAGQNVAQLGKPPVFFALERAFHGKLVGSVQLTHNPLYREAFQALGLTTRFVPPDQPEAFKQLVEDTRVTAFDVEVVDGRVRIVEKDFPIFSGFLVEPIQGEGGIHPLSEDYVRSIREICGEIGCPIIVDEIQSGMGRSGAFFASSRNGLLGDYYTLGKSLGGGLAKVSATLVRKSIYRKEFELLHSSTFAKDGFSTAIALKSLRILEADGGRAYQLAAEGGERIMAALREIAGRFPDVVTDVRGQGLLIGIEFADQSTAASPVIRDKARAGTLGYLLASYLLLAHGIRIGPTASAPNVLRIEPSIYVTNAEIAQLATGIEQVCLILRNSDALHVVHPLTLAGSVKPRAGFTEFRPAAEVAPGGGDAVRKVAFISYITTPGLLRELDPSLDELGDDELTAFVQRHELFKETGPLPVVRIDSPQGTSVDLAVYPLLVTPAQLSGYLGSGQLDGIRADIDGRVRAAKADGAEFAGLGFGTAAVTDNGGALKVPQIALSSGGALTVASAVNALKSGAQQRFGGLDGLTLAVVGGAGRIGSACAALAAEHVSKIVLVGSGRDGSAERLRAAAHRIYQDAWSLVAQGGELTGIPASLAKEPLIDKWLHEGRAAGAASGAEIAEYLVDRYEKDPFVTLTDELSAIGDAQLVLSAASSPTPFLTREHFREGAVVCDVAVPGTLAAGVASVGDELLTVTGGVLATPNGCSLPPGARGTLGTGQMYASAAEVVVLGLAGRGYGYSAGDITREQVQEMTSLAEQHGFTPIT